MQTRFSYDKELVKRISEFSSDFSFSSLIIMIATAIYYLYGIIYTTDNPPYSTNGTNIPCLSFFICTALFAILLFTLFKLGHIKKQIDKKLRFVIGLIYDIPAFVSLFYYNDSTFGNDKFYNISIAYLLINFSVDILFAFVDIKRCSVSKELISDLESGWLELKDTCICGLCLFSDGFKGGKYFELPYSEVRDVRILETSLLEKQYFNLCIDHAMGTYKLSVELPAVAKENILFICKELKEGRFPFENSPNNSEEIVKNSAPVMQFIYCTKCNTKQSSERKKCFRCGEPLL